MILFTRTISSCTETGIMIMHAVPDVKYRVLFITQMAIKCNILTFRMMSIAMLIRYYIIIVPEYLHMPFPLPFENNVNNVNGIYDIEIYRENWGRLILFCTRWLCCECRGLHLISLYIFQVKWYLGILDSIETNSKHRQIYGFMI